MSDYVFMGMHLYIPHLLFLSIHLRLSLTLSNGLSILLSPSVYQSLCILPIFISLSLLLSNTHTFNLLSLSLSSPSDISHTSAWLGRAMTGQRGEVIEFLSQSDSHQHRQFRHSQARRNRQGGHRVGLEPQLTTGGHRRLKPEEETGGNKCDGTLFNFTVHVFTVLRLICHQSSCSSSERKSEGATLIPVQVKQCRKRNVAQLKA